MLAEVTGISRRRGQLLWGVGQELIGGRLVSDIGNSPMQRPHLLSQTPRLARCRAGTLAYGVVVMVPLIGMISLAVDFGRVQVAKRELVDAVEAAARYAVTGLNDGTAATKAIQAAQQNMVDGRPLELAASDVKVGNYNATTKVFAVNGSPANAVVVSKKLKGSRGIPVTFARLFGFDTIAIAATSSATITATAGNSAYTGGLRGLVGREWFNISGSLTIRAWDSETQQPTSNTSWAVAQTMGVANLNGVTLHGELQRPAGHPVNMNGSSITKGVTTLNGNLNFPTPTVPPSGVTNMGNYNGPAGASQTFTAGKYYFDSFNVPSGQTVIFSGPVELYVNGSFNINGNVQTFQNKPGNLKVNIVSSAGGDISGNGSLYMDIYAPNSPFNLSGRTFYGSAIMKGVNISSATTFNIDRQSFDSDGKLRTTVDSSSSAQNGPVTIQTIRPAAVN